MFRYERPQKGRQRQFHQIGLEVFGYASIDIEVEILLLVATIWRQLELADTVKLEINSIGDAASRARYRDVLVDYFNQHRESLDEESQRRIESNPLRILDSKDPRDRAFVADAPKIDAYLSDEALAFFESVTSGLDAAGVKWARAESLVRGLDYYRHTAFEFIPDEGSEAAGKLGSQSTILGGGRYDGLMESLGGAPTPAVGWAAGIERLAMLVGEKAPEDRLEIAIIPMGESAETEAVRIARRLRNQSNTTEIFAAGKIKKRMARADAAGALYAVVIGDEELERGQVTLKSMKTGEQCLLEAPLLPQTLSEFIFEDLYEFEGSSQPPLSDRMPKKTEGSVFWTLPSGKIVDPLD